MKLRCHIRNLLKRSWPQTPPQLTVLVKKALTHGVSFAVRGNLIILAPPLVIEEPELTDALLGILYPHYLAPIPSMSVVQFVVDPEQGKLTSGHAIARGTPLEKLLAAP